MAHYDYECHSINQICRHNVYFRPFKSFSMYNLIGVEDLHLVINPWQRIITSKLLHLGKMSSLEENSHYLKHSSSLFIQSVNCNTKEDGSMFPNWCTDNKEKIFTNQAKYKLMTSCFDFRKYSKVQLFEIMSMYIKPESACCWGDTTE